MYLCPLRNLSLFVQVFKTLCDFDGEKIEVKRDPKEIDRPKMTIRVFHAFVQDEQWILDSSEIKSTEAIETFGKIIFE